MSSGEQTPPPPGPDTRAGGTAPTGPITTGPSPTGPTTAAPGPAPASDPPSGLRQPSTWPAQAADLIVDVVDTVRDRTTAPLLTVMRGVVYGTAIVILGITAVVLLIVALVRFVDVWLPGEVWSAYLLLGTLFTIAGLVLWATRRPREA
jgi:hypothetical protein